MALEDLVGPDKFIDALVISNPTADDPKSQGDDHIRGIKNVLVNCFPNVTGQVTATHDELNQAGQGAAPTGTVLLFAGAAIPAGYLNCDGSAVSRTTYAALFGVIGTLYGDGNGSTTFNLPDFEGIAAEGPRPGLQDLGANTGDDNIFLSAAQCVLHQHSHGISVRGSNVGAPATSVAASASGGNEQLFTQMKNENPATSEVFLRGPRLVVNHIIKT